MLPILERLDSESRERLLKECKPLTVKKGHNVYVEGDEANRLFFIKSGKIKVHKVLEDKKEVTIFIRDKMDSFGEIGIFSGHRYSCSSKAMINSKLLYIEKPKLEELLEGDGKMSLHFIKWVAESLEASEGKIRDYLLTGAEGAIASVLIRLSNMFGQDTPEGILIGQPVTNSELGGHVGISRETVNRIVNRWKADGVIDIQRKRYIIKDMKFLRTLPKCNDCGVVNCIL